MLSCMKASCCRASVLLIRSACPLSVYLPHLLKIGRFLSNCLTRVGSHVTSLLELPVFVKLISLSMRWHGRIESDDFITEMVDNNPILMHVHTFRSFQLDDEAFSDKQFKLIGPSLDDELNRSGGRPVI